MVNIDFTKKTAVTGNQKTKEREYWLDKLAGELVKSTFHKDFKHIPVDRTQMERLSFHIGGDAFKRLETLRNDSDHRLHMILTAIVSLLVAKHAGTDDVIIGTPIYKQQIEGEFINTILALRSRVEPDLTFKQLLLQVRETITGATAHQNYPIEILLDQLDIPFSRDQFPLFDIAILLENIHDINYIRHLPIDMYFSFHRHQDRLECTILYCGQVYGKESVQRIARRLERLIREIVFNIDTTLNQVSLLTDDEKERLLFDFSGIADPGALPSPGEPRLLHHLFKQQAAETPDNTAVIDTNGSITSITYRQLDERSDRLASFLFQREQVRPDDRVGVLMASSIYCITAILGILKAGAAYVPIDPKLPLHRIKYMIEDARIHVVISLEQHARILDRLQWECRDFKTYIRLDREEKIHDTDGLTAGLNDFNDSEESGWLSDDREIWEHVGETAEDEITGGGWLSSYTGLPLTKKEMDEYGDNVLQKLKPLLHPDMRVLEIGCASGITMYRIAPLVGFYLGTDLSSVIIRKNKERVQKEGFTNIALQCLPAHRVQETGETGFDLVIINSVIQDFDSHDYLRTVIAGSAALLKDKGFLFIGDIMDQDLKEDLIRDLTAFKRESAGTDTGSRYRTKTDWASELFISRGFFEDLPFTFPQVTDTRFSRKIHTIENELTRYRYDCLITIDNTRREMGVENGFRDRKPHKYRYDAHTLAPYRTEAPVVKTGPENLAYIIYTSGTTGIPNGVMIEHRNAVSTIRWFTRTYDFKAHPNVIQVANIAFDVSVEEIFGTLSRGGVLHIPGRDILLDKERLLQYIDFHKINVLQFVPVMLNAFLADTPKPESLDIVISGGDVLEETLKNRLIAAGYPLYNHYGPTEVTVDAAAGPCGEEPVLIGRPVSGAQVYIVDGHRQLQPVGVPGELLVGGNGLAREYVGNPEKTGEKFVPLTQAIPSLPQHYLDKLKTITPETRVYRTGDLACWNNDGSIRFIGRKDFQVKIRGFRIEPGEIETQLKKHPSVREAVVVTGTTGTGDHFLCAYIAGENKNLPPDVAEVKDYLSALLPDYMVPPYFVAVENIPLTPSGKVDRRKLPAVEAVHLGGGYTAPRDDVETQLADIWSEILNLDISTIGIDDNFFDRGGHSLKATVLISNIHKKLHVKIPLSEVFKNPSIRTLAQYVKDADQTRFIALKPAPQRSYYPLSSGQKRLYAVHQLGTNTSYNAPQALLVEGNLHVDRVKDAFVKLIHRHEILRTAYEMRGEEPVQLIQSPDAVIFDVHYMEANESNVNKLVEDFINPFDLSQAPQFRVALIRIGEYKHILVIDKHHILTDAVSDGIFTSDFVTLYTGGELPPLNLQYKDYSHWQNSAEYRGLLKKQEEYWLNRFKDNVPVVDLPLDFPRPALQTFDGEITGFSIEPQLARQLNEFVKREKDITLYMVLSAIFNILLSRYSGQEDIVVGFPITGRTHADLQGIIGIFVNMLALRNAPAVEKSFRGFLEEVKINALNAYTNQDFQYPDLVEKLHIRRDPGRNPLFDCVFSFEKLDDTRLAHEKAVEAAGLKVSPYHFGSSTSKFDLQLRGIAAGDHISLAWEYKTALFKPGTIEQMKKHFIEIAQQVMENPGIILRDIDISIELTMGVNAPQEDVEFNF